MSQIDFNVDAGEGFENESSIFPWVSSCNISCGAHAGSKEVIRETILLAKQNNLKIGAHPSFPDKENFGRIFMDLSDRDFLKTIEKQFLFFLSLMELEGLKIHHVKAHGALYHAVNSDREKAILFLQATQVLPYSPIIYGLPNSILEKVAKEKTFTFHREAFADRGYLNNGHLVPRKEANSVIEDQDEINARIHQMITHGTVQSISHEKLLLNPHTICFHGDHKGAEKRIKKVYLYVKRLGEKIRNG